MSQEWYQVDHFGEQPHVDYNAALQPVQADASYIEAGYNAYDPFAPGYGQPAPAGNVYTSRAASVSRRNGRSAVVASVLALATALGATGNALYDPSPERSQTNAAAPGEGLVPEDSAEPPFNPDAFWQGGRTVVHFADIKGVAPLSAEARDQARANVQAGIASMRTITGGQYPDMPVVAGQTLDLRNKNLQDGTKGISAQAACQPHNLTQLHLLAQREVSEAAPNEDMNIIVFNFPAESACKGPAKDHPATAQAYDERFIVVNQAEVLAAPEGVGVIKHEITHLGDEHDHDYGHDSALTDCGPESSTLDVDACTDVDEYGNVTTVAGYGFIQDGPHADPDPFTGFHANYLGLLPDAQVKTIYDDSKVSLQSIASASNGTKVVRIPVEDVAIPANKIFGGGTEKPTALHLELSQGYMREGMTSGPEVKAYLVDEKMEHPSTYSLPLAGIKSKYGLGVQDILSKRTIKLGDQNVVIRLDDLATNGQPGQGSAELRIKITGN